MGGEPPGKAQAMAPAPGEGGGAGGKGPGAPPSAEGEGPTGAEAKPKAKPGGEAATGAAGPKAGAAPRMSRPSVRMTPRGGGAQGSPRPAPAAGDLDLREVRPVLNPRFSHMSLDRGGRFARWVATGAAAAGGAGARRAGGLATPTGAGGDLREARHCACGQDGVVLVWGGGEGLPTGHFGGRCCPFGWGGHLGHFRPMGSNELDSHEWRSHSSRDADSGRRPHPFVSGSAAAHGHRGYLPLPLSPPKPSSGALRGYCRDAAMRWAKGPPEGRQAGGAAL